MKAFTLSLLALLASPAAHAFGIEQLVGKYSVSHPDFPVETTIQIDAEGKVVLEEKSSMGEGRCEGTAALDGAILHASVTCDNGRAFSQEIDLRGVSFLSPSFRAPVYSTLYRERIVMEFRRLD